MPIEQLITKDDLAEPYDRLASFLSIEQIIEIEKHFGGTAIYFPSLKNSVKDKIEHLVREQYTGYNTKQLAQKYGYTERHIQRIVSDLPHKGQLSISDIF
jgi:Mor family transcriptional regulator